MFAILKVKDKEYKLRMNSKTAVECEKVAEKSLLELAFNGSVESQVLLLQYLLKDMQHGFDKDKTYQLRDQMIEEGLVFEDIALKIAEGLAESGFIKKETLQESMKEMNKK